MLDFRPFLNTDLPAIGEIWRSHQPLRGLVQSMSPSLFEQHILAKPYFDRQGLILAFDDRVPLGFVHVGFGASEVMDDINYETAVISMIMVSKSHAPATEQRKQIALQLVDSAESYAASRGSQRILAGGSFPNNPFYLGLYGGSRLPGILNEDLFTVDVFEEAGFENVGEQGIWQCNLAGFRTIVNREQMQIRRKYNIRAEFDPAPRAWWEACTLGHAARMKFELIERSTDAVRGQVTFWDIQPLASHWGVNAAGLFDLLIDPSLRRSGLATFLIGEAIRQLKEHGATVAEVQTSSDDIPTIGLFQKLGFHEIDRGIQFEKSVEPGND